LLTFDPIQLDERLQKTGIKTHKQRVEELNKYLSNLSEHHDMYVVSSAFPASHLPSRLHTIDTLTPAGQESDLDKTASWVYGLFAACLSACVFVCLSIHLSVSHPTIQISRQ